MSVYSPVVPFSGYAGWTVLKRTTATQTATFEASTVLKRDDAYFREKIGTIKTAEALVSDKRLLRVALGAFGLDADMNNTYFIKKVLADGTLSTGALANKLADKQYAKLSKAFGFGDYSTPRTQISTFADDILKAYKTRQFEIAVGESNSDLRLAMNAEREIAALAKQSGSNDTKWYTIMGSPPLRTVFETALGLPKSFAAIDIDQQLSVLKTKSEKILGTRNISEFGTPANLDGLIRTFLIKSEAINGSASQSTKGMGALQMLQIQNQGSASAILSLLR